MNFFKFYKKYGIYIVLLLVIVFFSIASPIFLTPNNLINILRQVSMFGIVVVGVAIVTIGGGSDLSVGGQMAVDGIIAAMIMVNYNLPIPVAVISVLIIGAVFGLINGLICVKLGIMPLIVTLGTMLILQGMASLITGGYSIFGLPESFKMLGQGYIGPIPIPVIIFAVTIVIGAVLLNKTYFGRYVYALGGNPDAAHLAGINTDRVRVYTYVICGVLTSIAALIMLSRTNAAQIGAGSSYPFDCMTAACLGGVSVAGGEGNVVGAVVGVLILGILDTGLQLMNCDPNLISCIKGALLLLAVAIDCVQNKKEA